MRVFATLALVGLLALTACRAPLGTPGSTQPGSAANAQGTQTPSTVVHPPELPPQPKIALVLGGGAARGFAHVGVIRALEQEKVPIDLIVGTSVGALIGAIYAADASSFDLEWTAFQLQKDDLFDFGVFSTVTGMGFAKGDKLEAWVRNHVKTVNIEQLTIPFAAVATDLNWGQRVILDKGSVARAIRASAAIPGVFQPVQYQGKLLVDGGVTENIPISVARAKGADLVIAVDISANVGNTKITNLLDVTLQATRIMFALNVEQSKKNADVLITPAGIGDVGMLDFTQKKRCMQAGIDATENALPAIHRAIEAWTKAHTPVAP